MRNLFLSGFGLDRELCTVFLDKAAGLEYIPNPDFSYAQLCRTLERYALAEEKINLLGWSLGALFALRWTLDHPGKVNALFLTGATARFCAAADYDNGIKEKTLKLMIRQLPVNPQVVMGNFYASALEGIQDKDRHITRLLENLPPIACLLNGLQELLQTDLLEQVAGIGIPVCIYQGVQDRITPFAGARVLQSRLPAASIIAEPAGGHCLPVSHPEKTAACCVETFSLIR